MPRIPVGVLALAIIGGCVGGAAVAAQDAAPRKDDSSIPGGRPWPAHDPSTIVKCRDEYWLFSTGVGVLSARSSDLVHWTAGPPIFTRTPDWVGQAVPGNRGHFWAPEVIYHDDRYLVYYSVSTFGKNTSAIALASSPVLDPADARFQWTDHGIVIRSGPSDDYNAIDPCVVHGSDGSLWMAFGSFWSGIKLVQLDPRTGLRLAPHAPLHALAYKEQIEAAAIHRHGDYYYLFVNWGWCCRGVRSTYSIRVGRSREITGPYLDKDAVDLRQGGGSPVLESDGRFIGPGHAGVFEDETRCLLSYHFYDGHRNGRPGLAIRPLTWDEDSWPRVGEPLITPVPAVAGGQ